MLKNRWTDVLHTVRRGAILSLLIATSIALAVAPPAFASAHVTSTHSHDVVLSQLIVRLDPTRLRHIPGHSQGGKPSPSVISGQCLSENAFIVSTAANQANALGETMNNCPATVGGTQFMVLTNLCPGIGPGGNVTWRFSRDAGAIFDGPAGIDAGCVVCHYDINGVLTGETFPGFTLAIRVTALGAFTFHGTAFQATSDVANAATSVANDGAFAPTCPPTG